MMDTKTTRSNGVSPGTAGAIGQAVASKYTQTIVSLPVPPEAQAAAREREQITEVSVSDSDVLLETNPGTTKSEPAREGRVVASQDPTDPGVLQRRRRLQRRVAMAACGAVGIVAIAIAMVSRSAAHRGSVAATASASVPAVAPSSPPAAAPSASGGNVASVATVATVDPVAAQPNVQSPAASTPAKTPAPRAHPGRPRHAPRRP